MLGFCPLASGSKGNSIYVGSGRTKILIDAGMSARQTKERLSQLGVDISEISAIIITHEHTDHVLGLRILAGKMGIPVLANSDTARAIASDLGGLVKFKIFTTGEPFEFEDMEVHPFSVQHDAVDPVGLTVRTSGLKLGFCTDLGFATTLVESHLRMCDYLYLEANHEPDLVYLSKRPPIYKQRVLGRSGHLSNEACGQLLRQVYHTGLKHVHLAHLSSECNRPDLAVRIVRSLLDPEGAHVPVTVAPQATIGHVVRF